MRNTIILLAAIHCLGLVAEEEQDVEPPHEYYIEIGDKKVDVESGKPFKLDVSKDQELVLKQKPDRLFNRAGISFRFPQETSYEHKNEQLPLWTLKYKHSVVIIQVFKNQVPEAIFPVFLKGLEVQYKNQAKFSDASETLGSVVLTGKTVEPNIVLTAKLVQSVFPLKMGDDTVVILIQHTRRPDGTLYPESDAMVKLLKATFKVDEKK